MKILITGAAGLLGSKIAEMGSRKGHTIFSGHHIYLPTFGDPLPLDIANRQTVYKNILDIRPDAIIHCAAVTDVDNCERDKAATVRINEEGTKFVAEASKQVDALLIFISTDYVFDGSQGDYREEDKPNPVNFYGYSKWLGERAVMEINSQCLVARPSVIYGAKPPSGKTNFVLWVLENLKKGKEIKILDDQYVSPTLNINLAGMILEACERKLTGIYHMAGATPTSRFDLVTLLADKFYLNKRLIKRAHMEEMKWIASRPRDSTLNVSKANSTLKTKPMDLNEALDILKREINSAPRNTR